MKSLVGAFLVFAFAAGEVAGAAADSNDARLPIPQLSADTNAGAGLERLIETNPPVVPQVTVIEKPTPAEAQRRNTIWMILAVVGVLAGRSLVKRIRAGSGPSGSDPE